MIKGELAQFLCVCFYFMISNSLYLYLTLSLVISSAKSKVIRIIVADIRFSLCCGFYQTQKNITYFRIISSLFLKLKQFISQIDVL